MNSTSFRVVREPAGLYVRAIELARSLGDVPGLYGALTRLCNYNLMVAQYARSAEPMAELERIEQTHELPPALLHGGIFARAYTAFFTADFGSALRLFERLVPAEGEPSPFHGDLAGRTLALGHLACVRWVVGEPDRALEEAFATFELAGRLRSEIHLALAHVVRGRLRYLRRDPVEVVEEEAREAVPATALDVGLHTEASAFALRARALRGPLELSAIEPLLAALRQRLVEVSTCSTLVGLVLIDVLRSSGHLAEARTVTDEIITFANAHQEAVYLPELLRVRGEQLEATDRAAAIGDFEEAVALARRSGARSLESRAAGSLAAARGRR